MKRHRLMKRVVALAVALFAVLMAANASPQQAGAWWRHTYSNYQVSRSRRLPPTQEQAEAVLTPNVRNQLGDNAEWNGAGSFVLNKNQTGLNTNIASAPWAVNHLDSQGRPWEGDAWISRSTRQFRNRQSTGNGATGWKPAALSKLPI